MNPEKRALLPNIAFTSFNSKYKPPTLDEGFKDITEVKFQVRFYFPFYPSLPLPAPLPLFPVSGPSHGTM